MFLGFSFTFTGGMDGVVDTEVFLPPADTPVADGLEDQAASGKRGRHIVPPVSSVLVGMICLRKSMLLMHTIIKICYN